ncbi:MAG TPA: nucleoside triphosphate pyrophosphohydrolase [Streptosporangiaceae bacterium]|jgi:XTP/dITP diphosphohydrolase|nr:nucleoside triphosphate pyrophosphohydrolase [Streptosporangiaceae bacterium]
MSQRERVPVRRDDPPEPSEKAAGAALLDLVAVMDRLRTECPWDARQTHESLVPYLVEETYETLEAIERHDLAELRGELGDVLLQVLFHARIAAERTDGTGFTIDDVAKGIADKLVRRHPHVFGDVTVSGADEVKRNWESIKAEERAVAGGGPSSALDGVPMAQPALSLAAQLQRRAQSAGAPDDLTDLADLGSHRPDESSSRRQPGSAEQVSEIGVELFALVSEARAAGVDPELELRRAATEFRARFQAWERSSTRRP